MTLPTCGLMSFLRKKRKKSKRALVVFYARSHLSFLSFFPFSFFFFCSSPSLPSFPVTRSHSLFLNFVDWIYFCGSVGGSLSNCAKECRCSCECVVLGNFFISSSFPFFLFLRKAVHFQVPKFFFFFFSFLTSIPQDDPWYSLIHALGKSYLSEKVFSPIPFLPFLFFSHLFPSFFSLLSFLSFFYSFFRWLLELFNVLISLTVYFLLYIL